MTEQKKPLVLLILDGFGYSDDEKHNAIKNADAPVWQSLWDNNPKTLTEGLNGTNRMRLHVFGDRNGHQARLVALLDNLGKGASGAAVQNLNIMLGLPEETGLS